MEQVEVKDNNQLYTQMQKLSKEIKSFKTKIYKILDNLTNDLENHLEMMNQRKEDFFTSFGLKQIPELDIQCFNYDNYYLSSEFDEIKKQLQNLSLVLQEKQLSQSIQAYLTNIQQQLQLNPNFSNTIRKKYDNLSNFNDSVPGPHSYQVNNDQVKPSKICYTFGKRLNSAKRGQYPGPGTYDHGYKDYFLYSHTGVGFDKSSRSNLAQYNGNPGPGRYNIPSVFKSK